MQHTDQLSMLPPQLFCLVDKKNSCCLKIYIQGPKLPGKGFPYKSDRAARYRGGHWDFRFCGFGYFLIGFSVFVSKDFGFSVFEFNAVCGFFVF